MCFLEKENHVVDVLAYKGRIADKYLSLSSAAEEPINMIEVNAEAERYCDGWREAWKTMGMTMAQQSECEIAYIRGYRSGAESKPSSPAVKESLTAEPMTAEGFVIQKYGENWLNIMWFPEDVLDALEEYASKPTVAEREVGDE